MVFQCFMRQCCCRLVEDEHWSSASKEEGCRDALLPGLLLLDLGSADASQSAKVT